MPTQWYVRTSKADRGPYSTDKLCRLAESGKVKRETLVSRDGKKWIAASKVRGLKFGSGKRKPKPKPAEEDAEENRDYIPWTEWQSKSNSAQSLAQLGGDQLRERMADGANFFLARLRYSGVLALVACSLTYGLVRLAYILGWLKATSTESTLAWRIVLPAGVLVVVFGFLYWSTGRAAPGGVITDDMTDEEIAERL